MTHLDLQHSLYFKEEGFYNDFAIIGKKKKIGKTVSLN